MKLFANLSEVGVF